MPRSIKDLSIEEMEILMKDLGQPRYRADQVYEWIHSRNASSYAEMTNLPKNLRERLTELYPIERVSIKERFESDDGSVRYVIELSDGTLTEMVSILSGPGTDEEDDSDDRRMTACVSSQAGCPLECEFCATGKQGLTRDLTVDEIASQVVLMQKDRGKRVSNVVLMGQGEPFLNYDNVLAAIRRMNRDKGLGIGARHITISTSGIIEGIYDLAEEPEQFRLAVSLHSADQRTRNSLMPRLSGQPLHRLKKALKDYCDIKGRRITIEYMLLDGINDSDDQLDRLVEFCSGLNVHVNMIKFNGHPGSDLKPSSDKRMEEWLDALKEKGIKASPRISKGQDVLGACGQLMLDSTRD